MGRSFFSSAWIEKQRRILLVRIPVATSRLSGTWEEGEETDETDVHSLIVDVAARKSIVQNVVRSVGPDLAWDLDVAHGTTCFRTGEWQKQA